MGLWGTASLLPAVSRVPAPVACSGLPKEKTKTFGRRLFWRDLAYFQLHSFPDMPTAPIRRHYSLLRWSGDDSRLRCPVDGCPLLRSAPLAQSCQHLT